MDYPKMQDALTMFGSLVVNEVLNVIKASSASTAYYTFYQMRMIDHYECTKFLFPITK